VVRIWAQLRTGRLAMGLEVTFTSSKWLAVAKRGW